MKKFTLFLSALLISVMSFGETATLTFEAQCAGAGTDDKGNAWVVTSDAEETQYDATKGIHYGSGKKAVSFLQVSTQAITSSVTKVVVNASGASKTAGKLTVTVGGVSLGSEVSLTSTATEYTFEGNATGEIVVKLSQESATKALYVKSVAVTYGDDSGENPGENPGEDPGEEPGEDPGEEPGEEPGNNDEVLATVVMDFTGEEGLEKLGIAYPTTDAGNGAFSTDLEEGKAYSQNGVSLTAKHGSTATRVWLASSGKMDLRHYKGGVLTFAAPAGKVITQVVFDGADLTGLTTLVDKSWTGTATVVEIPAADDAKTIKINTITISLADAAADFVATPAIAGEVNFLDKTTVSITAEEGLKVYYTLDGTEPTNASTEYTAPFELTATTTVKAVAYDGDKASAVVEKTFTKMSILTCTEAVALCTATATTESYIVRGYVTEMIEAYNDKYKNITFWMADAQDGGQVLQAFRVKPVSDTDQEVKAGDYVEVVGTLVLYTKDDVSTPEINAGGSVKILEAAPTTAIDNVTVDQNITKFFENGQLVILKNGVRYNAQGAVVK